MKNLIKGYCLCASMIVLVAVVAACSKPHTPIDPPTLNNNPQLDMVLTNSRPILSASNPKEMGKHQTMLFEISADPKFSRDKTITYAEIKPLNKYSTSKQIEAGHELSDGTYYWRAKTMDRNGNSSEWVQTRFYLDVEHSRTFSGYLRAPVEKITVLGGQEPENIIDWTDQGQVSYWNSEPPAKGEKFSWVMLDMGKPTPLARFWMLSTRQITPAPGWLKHFAWQSSNDGKSWATIPGTEVKNNDTYRNIIDFTPVNARYYRLAIYSQNSLQAQLNVVIPYIQGRPSVPAVPDDDYVLLIGNQMNGFTYTQLADFAHNHGFKTVTIPHHLASLALLRALRNKPTAIIFSGNNADWHNLPMFEYYGEFEIYREVSDIPMMGICAGNEFYAISYGMSFAYWMGWFDDTIFRIGQGETPAKVEILPAFANDPIFKGVPNPFQAVEIHSWAINPLFLADPRYSEFVVTGKTSYIQMIKSTKRPIYSEQFHGAVVDSYNQSGKYLANFLEIARGYKAKR
jgi:anthranilate/para-aminobenzoate synthase component II